MTATLEREHTGNFDRPKKTGLLRNWVTRGIVLLLVTVIAALSFVLYEQSRTAQARDEATTVARDFAQTMFSYDAESLDDYIARVLQRATGPLAETFTKTSSDLREILIAAGATADAQVLEVAPVAVTAGEARVLVVVHQAASNSTITDSQQAVNAIVMTLQKIDGQWKASDIELPVPVAN